MAYYTRAAWSCLSLLIAAAPASASSVYITEFCSDTGNNQHYEFVEFTNVGAAPVDMTGWSEDDSSATPNKSGHSLSGLGILAHGESGIITEAMPAAFRTYWGLPASVPVVGNYTNDNLSATSDSITLFNSAAVLVDRLDYSTTNGGSGDAGISHATRTAPLSALGLNNNSLWVNSAIGDSYGSYSAPNATPSVVIGSPGYYAPSVPAMSILRQLAVCGALVGLYRVSKHWFGHPTFGF